MTSKCTSFKKSLKSERGLFLIFFFFFNVDAIFRESPQLVTLLKEMKDGLDAVRSKIQALTVKVDGVLCFRLIHLYP